MIITTKEVHNRIAGFDEKLGYAEDIDYGIRALKSGAHHHIFLNVRIRTSARRLEKDGRIKTALTWLRWHRIARSNRDQLFQQNDVYDFGNFKKS